MIKTNNCETENLKMLKSVEDTTANPAVVQLVKDMGRVKVREIKFLLAKKKQ